LDALNRSFESLHDPTSPTRCSARELSAMMRASRSDNLKCTFASYSRYINSRKSTSIEAEEEGGRGTSPAAGTAHKHQTRSKSPPRQPIVQVLDNEFSCLSTAVQAVLKIAMPFAGRRRSSSPRKSSSSPSKRSSQRRASPRRDDLRRYSAPDQPVRERTF
jgi:hypothetical protein